MSISTSASKPTAPVRLSPESTTLPLMIVLTFVTGVVDSVGYLGLDRVFVGNMTGNIVILGMCDEVPITPEKILKALDLKARGKAPRVGPERLPHVEFPEPTRFPPPWVDPEGRGQGYAQRGLREGHRLVGPVNLVEIVGVDDQCAEAMFEAFEPPGSLRLASSPTSRPCCCTMFRISSRIRWPLPQ